VRRQAEDSVKSYIAVLEAAEKAVDWALNEPEDLAGLVLTPPAELPLALAATASAAASMQRQLGGTPAAVWSPLPCGGDPPAASASGGVAAAAGGRGASVASLAAGGGTGAATATMAKAPSSSGLALLAPPLLAPPHAAPLPPQPQQPGGSSGAPAPHVDGGRAPTSAPPSLPPPSPPPSATLSPPPASAAPTPAASSGSSGALGGHAGGGGGGSALGELAHEVELVRAEELLEWYLAETESNLSDARLLVGRFDGERKSIQLELANTRNRLLKANMGIQLATMCMAGCSMVSGFFGMNLSNGTCGPEGCGGVKDAGFSVFASVAVATTLLMLLVGTLAWTRILKGL